MPQISNEAYVTLVTSDNYVAGACVLARSLRNSGTSRSIWCMAATKGLSADSLEALNSAFSGLTLVEVIDSSDVKNLALLGRPELGPTFTKLRLWQLTQFRKVVFMDADTLVLRNIDDLFERPELSACADVGWPDCFNSGVFVAVPSEETFAKLIKFANEKGSFDGGDQGLLNDYFSNWSQSPPQHRIPFTYNLTINASYSYAPAFARFQNDIKVIHFIGAHKPWTFYRFADGTVVPRGDSGCVNMSFVQEWWRVYDEIDNLKHVNCRFSGHDYTAPSNGNAFTNKVYASSVPNHSGAQNTCFSSNPDADFANYRIKWSADVEKYFSQQKASPSNTSKFLFPALSKQQHPFSRNHRVLGGELDDDSMPDCRYYED